MKIYIGHPTDFDYQEKLYQPLKESSLADEHELVLPHDSEEFFNSKDFLRNDCDLVVAEVSQASTGLGIELGWAGEFDVSVVCIYEKGAEPSGSLKAITDEIVTYKNSEEMVEIVEEAVEENR